MDRLIIASLWALIAINIMFIISSTMGSLFMCWPIQKSWHPNIDGTCGDRAAYVFGKIGVTIITDVLVSLIPAWVLYDLRMPLKNKAFMIVFLLLPLTVTAIRCYRLHKYVEVMKLPMIYAEDSYNIRSVLSNLEANLGVIAACGATIKWMLVRISLCTKMRQVLTVHLHYPEPFYSLLRYQSEQEFISAKLIPALPVARAREYEGGRRHRAARTLRQYQ